MDSDEWHHLAQCCQAAQWRELAEYRLAAYGQAQVGSGHWQTCQVFITTSAYHQPFTLNQIAGMIALQAINVSP